jgi:transcription initiation factor TFIID subunit 6
LSNPELTMGFPFLFRFGDDYATLKARVLRTLCDAAAPDKCLPTQYGGFVAITLFGSKAINAFLLPLALEYWKTWETTLNVTSDLNQRMELLMCQQATLDALGVFLMAPDTDMPENAMIKWHDLEETFGDRLVMTGSEETEYVHCLI